MNADRIALIICAAIGGAVLIPLLIYASLRRQNVNQQIELLKRAASRSRQPWVHEDESLQELSRLIGHLKKNDPDTDTQPKNNP